VPPNLSKEIRECYGRAEQCKRLAEGALTLTAKADYLGRVYRRYRRRGYYY
jgi:hypothetical protein